MKANNSVSLIGRLTRDPSDKSKDGYAMAAFSVAVDGSRRDAETDFFDCVAFGKTAQAMLDYGAKGRLVAVVGSVHVRSYDGRDGIRRKSLSVTVEAFQLLDKREMQGEDQREPQGGETRSEETGFDAYARSLDLEIDAEDLPF